MINWSRIEYAATIRPNPKIPNEVELIVNNYSRLLDVLNELGISALVYTYLNSHFSPIETYLLKIGEEKIKLSLNKEFGLDVYHQIYESIVENKIKPKGLKTFLWLVEHTEAVVTPKHRKYILYGDEEFNEAVMSLSMNELIEILGTYPYLNFDNERVHAVQTEQIIRLFDSKDWNFDGQYVLVSKLGYLLPFEVLIEWDEVLEWAQSIAKSINHRITYEMYQRDLHIFVNGKNDWQWVLNSLNKRLGVSEPAMAMVTNFSLKEQVEFTAYGRHVVIHNRWLMENKNYAQDVLRLVENVDFSFATKKKFLFSNYFTVLENSQYDAQRGILYLEDYLYGELNLRKSDITEGLYEVSPDHYKKDEEDFGDVEPITSEIHGVRVATPFKRVYNNRFEYAFYPIRWFRRYNVPPVRESYLNPYIMNESRPYNKKKVDEAIQRQGYLKQEDLVWDELIDYFVEESGNIPMFRMVKRFDGLVERVENVPGVSQCRENNTHYIVTQDGHNLTYSKDLEENDILQRVVLNKEDAITEEDERDIAGLLIAIYEQGRYKSVSKREDSVWYEYLQKIVTRASEYYYVHIGRVQLFKLLDYPPASPEELVASETDTIFKEFSINQEVEEQEYEQLSEDELAELMSQLTIEEDDEQGDIDLLSMF